MANETKSASLLGVAPYFKVKDIARAAAFYRDVLGFSWLKLWGEPPCFCMPKRDGLILMLSQAEEPGQVRPHGSDGESWDAYFWVKDAEALFAEFKAKDAPIAYAPTIRTYYNMKEFAVKDLDGHVLAFGQDWPAAKNG